MSRMSEIHADLVVGQILSVAKQVGKIVSGIEVEPRLHDAFNLNGKTGPDVKDGPASGVRLDAETSSHADTLPEISPERRSAMADTPRVTVPVEPTEAMIDAWHKATWPQGPRVAPLSQQGLSFARSYRAMLSAAPAPDAVAAPFDRDALIALIMEETTDDIVADGWDRLGKPNVLVQGCRYIRRNAPPSPEGYANPEASAKQFAGFIADRVLKALAPPAELLNDPQQLEAPAEAGDDDGDIPWPDTALSNALHKHFSDLHGLDNEEASEEVYGVLDVLKALRAQPPAREDAQPVGTVTPEAIENLKAGGSSAIRPPHHAGVALYTHPAPDALRAAVEALEPFALLAPGEDRSPINMNDPLSRWITIGQLLDASKALAALASGSGDHAELARDLRAFEGSDDLGDGDFTVCEFAADALEALLAENAALRAERDTWRQLAENGAAGAAQHIDRATEAERALSEHRITADLLVSSLKADRAEAERKLAEAVGLNERAANLMRQCTEPDRFEDASTLNVYANMRAWLSDLSKEAERG